MLRLTVVGPASNQMLLRVVDLLEVRGLALRALYVDVGDQLMVVRIGIGRPEGRDEVLLERLRAIVGVDDVTVGWRTACPDRQAYSGAQLVSS